MTLPMTVMVEVMVTAIVEVIRLMNMPIGSPTLKSSTRTIVRTFMIKNAAPTAQDVRGLGLKATLRSGAQATQNVAVKPRRPSFGVQVVQISQMGSAEHTVQNAAKLASLTILTQQKSVAAKPGGLTDYKIA